MSSGNLHLAQGFFGLQEQPFAPTADPAYFYASSEHRECLFRLWNSVDEQLGIAVVLGNYGTGKTTLLRKLLTGMAAAPDRYTTAVIASPVPSWTSFALLESIANQFRLHPEKRSFVSYMEALHQFLIRNRDRISTLIIDDAQNLNKRGQLELLRLVQNLETPQRKLINLVFFAQLEWAAILRAAPNFEQRVNMTYTLSPLTVGETRRLIEFRLQQAGADEEKGPSFDDAAIRVVHAHSAGNPRVTVTLCRNAVLLAAHIGRRRIGQDIVLHTIEKTTLPDAERRREVARAALGETPAAPPAAPSETPAPRTVPPEAPPQEGRAQRTNEKRAADLLLRAAREKQK